MSIISVFVIFYYLFDIEIRIFQHLNKILCEIEIMIKLQHNIFGSYLFRRNYCKKAYIQGQIFDSKIREYFYYIDHEGMVC